MEANNLKSVYKKRKNPLLLKLEIENNFKIINKTKEPLVKNPDIRLRGKNTASQTFFFLEEQHQDTKRTW